MAPLSSPTRPLGWRIVHGLILLHFAMEFFYTGYQTMVVIRPPGVPPLAPLGAAASQMDDAMFLKRRLYAMEHWIAFGGFAVYLAITEIAPRFSAKRDEKA